MDDLNEDSFDAYIARDGIRFVVFSAPNCRPSRSQLAEMRQLAGANFASVDALMHDSLRRRMNIRCLPTTLVFRDGALAETMVGYQPRQRIEAIMRKQGRQPAALAA